MSFVYVVSVIAHYRVEGVSPGGSPRRSATRYRHLSECARATSAYRWNREQRRFGDLPFRARIPATANCKPYGGAPPRRAAWRLCVLGARRASRRERLRASPASRRTTIASRRDKPADFRGARSAEGLGGPRERECTLRHLLRGSRSLASHSASQPASQRASERPGRSASYASSRSYVHLQGPPSLVSFTADVRPDPLRYGLRTHTRAHTRTRIHIYTRVQYIYARPGGGSVLLDLSRRARSPYATRDS